MPNIRMIFECESIAQLTAELTQQLETLNGSGREKTKSQTAKKPPAPPKPETSSAPVSQPAVPITLPAAPIPTVVPTTAATYTLERLVEAVTPIARDNSKLSQLQSLLNKYGVQGMADLPAEAYGAFAADIRALGARI